MFVEVRSVHAYLNNTYSLKVTMRKLGMYISNVEKTNELILIINIYRYSREYPNLAQQNILSQSPSFSFSKD